MNENLTLSPFWMAMNANDAPTVGRLLDADPELVHERVVGEPWVAGMIWDGELGGGNIPAPAGFGFSNTALHIASLNSYVDIARLLLSHGADPNALGYERNQGLAPPVVLAAWEGSLEMLQLLLESGADPNLPASCDGALYTAAEHHSEDKVELLLAHGARHSVFTAAITGDLETLMRLLAAYPTLSEARSHKRGRTPLEEAVHHDQHEVAQALKETA